MEVGKPRTTPTSISNPLAEELFAARGRNQARLMIEGKKAYYKVSYATFSKRNASSS